ncbi:hypothetical protein AAULR_08990 [Lacticaseibacillus rhamnosus MTCC 5462]|nr:hypothetical protein AAULR_08990 [Lacticaseibacillus rhamnosus MTCC 5462]
MNKLRHFKRLQAPDILFSHIFEPENDAIFCGVLPL